MFGLRNLFLFAFGNFITCCAVSQSSDCYVSEPICQGVFNQTNAPSGANDTLDIINPANSCLVTGELNAVWYSFTVQTSGDLCFSITPNNPVDDYDWALFNLSNSICDSIFSDPSLEVSCNYSSNLGCNGITGPNGNTTGPCGGQNEACVAVLAGESYSIVVSQFSISTSGYSLDFNQSTASIFDNSFPYLQSANTSISDSILDCGSTELTIGFSEDVVCSSVNPADFSISGPSGTFSVTSLSSLSCDAGGTFDRVFTLQLDGSLDVQGVYSVQLNGTIQDNCGNVNSNFQSIDVSVSAFNIQTTTQDAICVVPNGQASVNPSSGTSPYFYSWSNGQTNSTCTGLYSGVYSVIVTDSLGCIANDTITINQLAGNSPLPQILSITDVSCFNGSDGTANLNSNGGTAPYLYSWPGGQTNANVVGISAGSYLVTVTENGGCNDTIRVNINQPSEVVTTTSSDTIICIGGSAVLSVSASGGNGGYVYSWSNGTNTQQTTVSPLTNQSFTVTVTDNLGCPSSASSISIQLYSNISTNTVDTMVLCEGDSIYFSPTPTGGFGNYSYNWNTGETSSIVSLSPNSTTSFMVTISDACETPVNVTNITIVIETYPDVSISSGPISGCSPLTAVFTLDTFDQDVIYIWDFGDGSRIQSFSPNPSHVYEESGCFDLGISATSPNGCITNMNSPCFTQVHNSPEALFSTNPSNSSIITPDIAFINHSIDSYYYQWDVGDGNTYNRPSFQHTYLDSGTYLVSLIVQNEHGCLDTASGDVFIDWATTWYVPNTFTPNNDGVNDIFNLVQEGIQLYDFSMMIFDRWGNLIFETTNPKEGWNGKSGTAHISAHDGFYAYKIEFKDHKSLLRELKGSVLLLNGVK